MPNPPSSPLAPPSTLITGIDEAGYGPTLGPLVIVRASTSAIDEPTARAALHDAGVRDSKRLHRSNDLAPLEQVALAGLAWLSGFQPDTAADAFALLGEGAAVRDGIPWMAAAQDLRLPVAAETIPTWRFATAQPRGLAGAIVQPAAYNAWLRGSGNKADLELHHVGTLLRAADCDTQAQEVVVDRLGGRKFYADPLRQWWPDATMAMIEEGPLRSCYQIGPSRIAFLVGGEDACTATALASCIAKYVRELHMLLLNRWWSGRLRWLKPTAGYPEDAKRWLHQIGEGHTNAFGDALVRGWRGPIMTDDHG